MVKRIEGSLTVEKQKFALVVSRFNEFITSKLVSGAIDTLVRHGCAEDDISSIYVPGAFGGGRSIGGGGARSDGWLSGIGQPWAVVRRQSALGAVDGGVT